MRSSVQGTLLLAAVALAGLACVVLIHSPSGPSELMYGHGNNWGGFLTTSYGEGLPRKHPANRLTKQDLALLKVAHDEELKEAKDGMQAKKHDEAALDARTARLAKAKKVQAAMHSQQLAAAPAPFLKKQTVHQKNHLSSDDQKLLTIATREMKKETKTAISDKKEDQAAEKVREEQKKAAKEAKAKAAKAQAAHSKHVGHKIAAVVGSGRDGVDSSWGGFLSAKHPHAGALDPKALALLKKAQASQKTEIQRGEAARARDQLALQTKDGANKVDTGKVHSEAQSEFAHIEGEASIGLNAATSADASEERQAWGGV